MELFSISQLQEIIAEHYQIGKLVNYEQLLIGYENITYIIETELNNSRSKYCFRRYNRARREEDIQFEHSVINHLVSRGFDLTARIIKTIDGRSYVKRLEGEDNRVGDVFYAIFDFLPGEDKYIWYDPPTSREVLSNVAVVLARFHNATFDLNPAGQRDEPEIIEFIPTIARQIEERAEAAGKTQFEICLLDNLSLFTDNIDRTLEAIDNKKYQELPHQVIHRDYHPGNLKFQNKRVTGLFDYDWTKIEARCYDVAYAVTHFCTLWKGKQEGHLGLDKATTFLDSYQKTLKGSKGVVPLTQVELRYLPHLIRAGIIYWVYWFIEDFYDTKTDSTAYPQFLEHYARIIRWLDNKDNWDTLEKICAESAIS
ncbi:phosphotransferase [Chloroflexota bacterium]